MRFVILVLSLLMNSVIGITQIKVVPRDSNYISDYSDMTVPLVNYLHSPYEFSLAVDFPITSIAIGTGTAYLIMNKTSKPFTMQELNALDRNDIWVIDRGSSYNWSPQIAKVSDGIMYTSFVMPFGLLADRSIRRDYHKVIPIFFETFALTAGLTTLTKTLTLRPRPLAYNENAPIELRLRKDARYSFFSGHTSTVAAMSFMTVKIFQDYHPNHKALPYLWAGAAALPLANAILRQQAGKHYWTDVAVGYAIGGLIGYFVPHLHKIHSKKKKTTIQF